MRGRQLVAFGERIEINAIQERWGRLALSWSNVTRYGGSSALVLQEADMMVQYARYAIAERHAITYRHSTGFKTLLKGVIEQAQDIFQQVMTTANDEKIKRHDDDYVQLCHKITTLIRDVRDLLNITPRENPCYEKYTTISARYDQIDTWSYKLPYQNKTQQAG